MQRYAPVQWNAYPALLLAGAFALGIWAGKGLPLITARAWSLFALATLGGASAGYLWPRRRLVTLRPLAITLAIGIAVAALGGARTASFQHLGTGHVGRLLSPRADIDDVTLNVRVVSAVERTPRGARFTAYADTLAHQGDTLSVRGKVRVFFRSSSWESGAPFPVVQQGDRVHLRGRLQAPPARRNPADFDYGAYLQRKGIRAVATVNEAGHVAVTEKGANVVISRVAALRAYVVRQVARHVRSAEARSVLWALLVGDRGHISEATQERFAATGLLHLLAISGLHVLLVGMIFYTLMRPTLMRVGLGWRAVECTRAASTLLLLCGFALLTGGRPSVVRAVVMAGLFIGGNVLQRNVRSLNTLGVAALVLLAARPLALFDAGFQLSFAAVGAIVTLNPRIQGILPQRWRHDGWRGQLGTLITVSVAATLGTMPVLLVHFGHVSFAGIALNVVAIPLTALALLSGMLTAASGWTPLGSAFGAVGETLTKGLLQVAEVGDAWLGWFSIDGFVQDPWVVLVLVLSLVAVVQWPRPKLRWRLVAAALLFASIGTWMDVRANLKEPRLQVVFFDVGQGDAALISLPNGRHMLVDTGPRTPYFDAAESFIIPQLDRWEIERLDAVVISHSDSDHLGGLPTLLQHLPVGRVVFNRQGEQTGLVEEVDQLVDSLDVPVQSAWAGDTLALDPAVHLQVLGPPAGAPFLASDNDASLVLRLVYGETRVLFTGDIEAPAERWLSRHYGALLQSDVVKVSHHGSSTSSLWGFVREAAVDSGAAVVSVGARNPFGFPASGVLRRWRRAGMDVLTTADDGAVWFRSSGKRLSRIRWR